VTELKNDIVATLRRRAKELGADGYNDTYTGVLLRAAEVLDVHRRFLVSGEQFTIEVVAANRLLRNALVKAHGCLLKLGGKHAIGLDMIRGTLGATKEPGIGRHIITMEVTAGKTREQLDEEIRVVLDAYFKKGETNETEEGTDTEPAAGDAGRSSRAGGARQQAARRVP
jgi:hypothetical protein